MSISIIILIIIGAIVFLSLVGVGVWIWAAKKIFKMHDKMRKDFDDEFFN